MFFVPAVVGDGRMIFLYIHQVTANQLVQDFCPLKFTS